MAAANFPACSSEKPARNRGRLSVGWELGPRLEKPPQPHPDRYPSAPSRGSNAPRPFWGPGRSRARKFCFRVRRPLQSRVGIAKLEMRVGIIGTLRDVFLERLKRRCEIHLVHRVLSLL